MATRGILHISLARKCQLLFGLAVLLIIAAALFVPGYYMEMFIHEMNFRRARHLAVLAHARIDPAASDWDKQQASLKHWWHFNAKTLNLPEAEPRLVIPPSPDRSTRAPAGVIVFVDKWGGRLRSAGHWLGKRVPLPAGWQLAMSALQLVPDGLRERVAGSAASLFRNPASVLAAGTEPYPRLDDFQGQCVREMQANDAVNEQSEIIRSPGQPPVYRFVLAVRSMEAAPARRPLVGIIDAKLPVTGVSDALFLSRIVIVSAGMLAGFLAILVFYLISQRLILAPVRELKALVEQIGGGDFTARAAIATGDEFEELSDAFNDMLSRLERARVELETINRSLDAKLGELAETNVALFESNRLKSEFLASVSHELRTPLTSIIGFADLLRDSVQTRKLIDDARAARYVDNIMTSGRMLLELINDLLDLAKIEAGKVELHRASFSVRDVCEALGDFMRPTIENKGLTMAMNLDEDLPMMHSDAGKVRQVLYNLLSNAVKYTPRGGRISLEANALDQGRHVRLAVADTGPGIAPENHQRIFEKFRQLDASVTREHSGTGLGLGISRELCTMLGGTISVESELGKGARFIVELPVECPETVYRPVPLLM